MLDSKLNKFEVSKSDEQVQSKAGYFFSKKNRHLRAFEEVFPERQITSERNKVSTQFSYLRYRRDEVSPSHPQQYESWLKSNIKGYNSDPISTLKSLYQIREIKEVKKFLSANPELIPILIRCHRALKKHFPTESLVLNYIVDPEITTWEKLKISIHVDPSSLIKASEKLDKFDANWWADIPTVLSLKLAVDIAFD